MEESERSLVEIRDELDGIIRTQLLASPAKAALLFILAALWIACLGTGFIHVTRALPLAPLMWVAAIWVATCILLLAIYAYSFVQHRRRLIQGLRETSLLQKLTLGWDQLPDIHQWVMSPWSFMLSPRPTALSDRVRLLALNLDWFLADPKKLFRIHWLIPPLGITLGLASVITIHAIYTSPEHYTGRGSSDQPFVLILSLTLGVLFPLASWLWFGQMQEAVRTRVLRDYLDEVLE